MVSMGELIEWVLAIMGWGIYRLDRAQGVTIESALSYNTPQRTDELYRNRRVLRRY